MPEYQCESCSFRFEASRQPLRCPFCGKANTVRPMPSAEDLMDEVREVEKKMQDRT